VATTIDGIIAADRAFTIPGIVILLIGGIGAAIVGGIPILKTGWLLWGIVAFILSGGAFGPLSWGTIALLFPVIAFALMILKPALPASSALYFGVIHSDREVVKRRQKNARTKCGRLGRFSSP
jgi:hypothetical protein